MPKKTIGSGPTRKTYDDDEEEYEDDEEEEDLFKPLPERSAKAEMVAYTPSAAAAPKPKKERKKYSVDPSEYAPVQINEPAPAAAVQQAAPVDAGPQLTYAQKKALAAAAAGGNNAEAASEGASEGAAKPGMLIFEKITSPYKNIT